MRPSSLLTAAVVRFAPVVLVLLFQPRAAVASPRLPDAPSPLVVGAIVAPPFVMKSSDGTWSGLSIDLWSRVAHDLGYTYSVREMTIPEVDRLGPLGVDVFVSRNVSTHAVEVGEMSHAFLSSGLAIATRSAPRSSLAHVVSKAWTRSFAEAVGLLFLVVVTMGVVVSRLERHTKPEEFGGHPVRAIAHGTFWALESIVGKAAALSKTLPARLTSLAWSLIVTVVISGITAKLASELTVNQLATNVRGVGDLPHVHVAAVSGTSAARYLDDRGISWSPYPDASLEVAALARGEVDAVVDEAPLLAYQVHRVEEKTVVVLPGMLVDHGYGFAFPGDSRVARDVDLAMLRIVESQDWAPMIARYLGPRNE